MCSVPAAAADGPGLAEVLAAVKAEARLVQEVEVELRRRDLKVGDIICSAARHGGQWRFLGGWRTAPYECTIGDRELRIEAERTYFDVNGHRLGRVGEAPDRRLLERARSFRETKFRWTWSP
jgi:hypothetical protein